MPLPGRPFVWLHADVKTPPFSAAARLEAGALLRQVQDGRRPGLPHARPMPSVGARYHELRIQDATAKWRIIYRLAADAVVIVEAFSKKAQQTPAHVIDASKDRLRRHDAPSA